MEVVAQMIFHEIYSSYYNIVADVLKKSSEGILTDKLIYEIIREKGFGESMLGIPAALKDEWSLLAPDMSTPIKHAPKMALTLLQKRWLKALLNDPRIKLFGVTCAGLEDVEPLYSQDVFCYFDRYNDGDPYDDIGYISRFKSILCAIREKKLVEICYIGRHGSEYKNIYFPWKLEYSSKDDKFRLLTVMGKNTYTINLSRIISVLVLNNPNEKPYKPKARTCELEIRLTNKRNALERAMLQFSHLQKETIRLDDKHYQMTLYYDKNDETELLIRILSFGPMLHVVSPDSFIELINERLRKQQIFALK